MSNFSSAFAGILTGQGHGSGAILTAKSGIGSSVISGLRKGKQIPELSTLRKIVENISDDRDTKRQLVEAYVWDVIEATGLPLEWFSVGEPDNIQRASFPARIEERLEKVGRLAEMNELNFRILDDVASLYDEITGTEPAPVAQTDVEAAKAALRPKQGSSRIA